jgi:N-acetylglucosamine-6-sulfatase
LINRTALIPVLTIAAMLLATSPKLSGQTTRRNVVVILLDDFDTTALNVAVARNLAPNIKRYFIDEGVNFSNAIVTSTFGSPTRATFLTGQYPHNHGEIGGDANVGSPPKLNQNSTVATWLRNSGYRTAHVGRYLTGYGWFTPATSIPPGWDDWFGLVDPSTWSTEQYVINANGSLIDVGALAQSSSVEMHQIDVLSYLAGAVVQQAPSYNKPFFLVVSPTTFNRERAPGPTTYNVCPDPLATNFGGSYWGVAQKPPARYRDTVYGNILGFALPQDPSFNENDVSDKPLWAQTNPLIDPVDIDCLQKRYWRKLENLRAIDDLVGNVMTRLQEAGALSNTVVMFTSDAGDVDGQHRMPEKMAAYEPSIRVPLLVRIPGVTPRTESRLVLNTDLAPTIADIALVTPTITVDGRSLQPLIQNPYLSTWRRMGLIEHVYTSWTPGLGFPPNYLAIRTEGPVRRTFVRYPTITTGLNGELYDLNTDPYQLQNLYLDPARQTEVGRLNLFLTFFRNCRGSTCAAWENSFTFN